MHRSSCALTVMVALSLSVSSASAAQRGHSGGPKPKPVSSVQAPKTHSPKVSAPKNQAPKPHAPKSQAPKAHPPKTHTSGPGDKGTPKGHAQGSPKTDRTTAFSNDSTLSPAQQKLQRNTNLADKLRSRLPAGTDLMLASDGFRNLGQFVAAVNVSNNLNIPFSQLKSRMVDDGLSLGQAIKDLRPTADATFEARRAERDAAVLIEQGDAPASKVKPPKNKDKDKDKAATDKPAKAKPSKGK